LFSWIYDVPSLLAIILFGAGFVAIFWLGLLLLRPFVRRLLPQEPGLNATLTMYLQYFGIIYGLLLGLLAVGAYQNHAGTRRSVVAEAAGLAALVAGIYGRMAQFEPGTQGQAAIHQTALKQFDSFVEARRTRLYRVSSGMPHVMWYTVALGALINMIFLWLFDLGVSTHLLLGGLVSLFTATMI